MFVLHIGIQNLTDFVFRFQLFIDYVHIVSRVPLLRENQQAEDVVPDASETSELESLSGRIPKLIGILPDVLRDKPGGGDQCSAALSHMLSRLLDCLDPSEPVRFHQILHVYVSDTSFTCLLD